MDADGDGVGDFCGLSRRLDHLASGIRVIIDLVVNHTSDRHPRFEESRSSRDSPRRRYVWSDAPVAAANAEVFPGEQHGNWTYDERTDQYHFHRFHPFQPDLNLSNRAVRMEILQTMGFWLELGVDGFRLDAVPFLIETHGPDGPPREEHHDWLREIHSFVDHRRGDAVLLGEANIEPDRLLAYFGGGDEMQLLFNYSQTAALLAAIADESAEPLRAHLATLPDVPLSCGWLNFVRIHDELNLERLDDDQRRRVFERFAPDPELIVYDRGLRCRVAPMLGDRRLIELAYSLTFSLPGMPLLYYGDEIGMGHNLALEGRMAVRTPMQWDADPSGGFSAAPPDRLVRPLVTDPGFGPASVNVAAQRDDPDSLLKWMHQLVDVRRRHPAIGLGHPEFFECGPPDVLGHHCRYGSDTVAGVHNLTGEPRQADLSDVPVDVPLSVIFTSDGERGTGGGKARARALRLPLAQRPLRRTPRRRAHHRPHRRLTTWSAQRSEIPARLRRTS